MSGHLTLLALAPSFTKGVLVTICGFVLFVGGPYLLASAVLGLRMGYLVIASAFFAWMIILAALWTFGFYSQGLGTKTNLGPRGTEPHWQVIAAGTGSQPTKYTQTADYPDGSWWTATVGGTAASSVPTVSTAFQTYLVGQATKGMSEGAAAQIQPAQFVVLDVKFSTAQDGKTHLAAATAFFASGGPKITLFAYHDRGDVPMWSWIFLIGSALGFAVHVPFLDRAEKSRRDVLVGGTAPAWYGPA